MENVQISIEQLKQLSDVVCDIDFDKQSPEKIAALVEKAHDLIIEMLGDNEGQLYADDDKENLAQSEVRHVH